MLLSDAVRTAEFWFSDEICSAISLRRMRTDRGAEKPSLTVSPEVWDQLKAYAALTLLEVSEASRAGAGPSE